jgi:hypothetical protein
VKTGISCGAVGGLGDRGRSANVAGPVGRDGRAGAGVGVDRAAALVPLGGAGRCTNEAAGLRGPR